MHIQNVNINVSVPAFGTALLSALMRMEEPEAEDSAPAAPQLTALPRIGEAWPGIDGVYAGVSRGEEGEPDAHLVLLNASTDRSLTWEAAQAWATGLGDGARLPTRFESALLYANVQDKLDTEHWHWTGTQYSSSYAWYQYFDNGNQSTSAKKAEGRCRAVRRLTL